MWLFFILLFINYINIAILNRCMGQNSSTRKLSQMDIRDSIKLLKKHNINISDIHVADDEHDVVHLTRKSGFPLAMKIVSKDVIHKTDSGCVILNIANEREAIHAYKSIKENAGKVHNKGCFAHFGGVSIQKMHHGIEFIVGMKRDAQFGPVMIFGLGGIFVETLKDIAMMIAPIKKNDAIDMIHSIRSAGLLKGVRGMKPADIPAVAELLMKMSKLAIAEKQIKEIDLNPVMINGKDISIVDIRILAEEKTTPDGMNNIPDLSNGGVN